MLRLFGYAGTGKSTLARHLGASHYAAFTGKAAYVMRSLGCEGATTIHKLIYLPRERSKERLEFLERQLARDPEDPEKLAAVRLERERLKRPSFVLNEDGPLRAARLLVVDECSMVDERLGRDLLSFGCKVLVLGDPFQLPPVKGGGYFTSVEPEVMLTEVHRQARDNPIIDLATRVRTEKRMPAEHPLIVPRATEEAALAVEQLIVGTNRTRFLTNQRIRQLTGRTSETPEVGERVVCLRNNHDLGLLNGATYEVTALPSSDSLELDGDLVVAVHPEPFLGQEVPIWSRMEAEEFDYGYALTCHKAQGSQWRSVGVINEARAFGANAARWMYTAVTRASQELWVTR